MTGPGHARDGCAGQRGGGDRPQHGSVSEELHALAELLAERLAPWSEQLHRAGGAGVATDTEHAHQSRQDRDTQDRDTQDRDTQDRDTQVTSSCTWCPVCSVLDLLRGQRPELAARLTVHGAGLLAAVREALATPADGGARPDAPAADRHRPGRAEQVQHVPVRRPGREGPRAGT